MSRGEATLDYPSSFRGMSIELPFIKLRYVSFAKPAPKSGAAYARAIDVVVPSGGPPEATTAERVVGGPEARVESLGMDPIVSFASVIHELTYGRIETASPAAGRTAAYPVPGGPTTHFLDVVV